MNEENAEAQQFLKDLDRKLWTAALRSPRATRLPLQAITF